MFERAGNFLEISNIRNNGHYDEDCNAFDFLFDTVQYPTIYQNIS